MCARKWGQGSESAYIKPKTMLQSSADATTTTTTTTAACATSAVGAIGAELDEIQAHLPSPALAEIIYALLISIGGDD